MTHFVGRWLQGLKHPLWASFIGLGTVFLILTFGSILIGDLSLTYDEPQHFRYGEQVLGGDSERFDDSKMPISVLNVVAVRALRRLIPDFVHSEWQAMALGRTATVVFSLGLGVLTAVWAARLGTGKAGLLALTLYVFEPNILAHSSLITTDVYAAGTITLALYAFWEFLRAPSPLRGTVVGLTIGLAQIAKYTGLLLYPLLPVLAVLHFRRELPMLLRGGRRWIVRALGKALVYGVLLVGLSLLVINVGFLFERTGMHLADLPLRSPLMRTIQSAWPLVRKIPMPVPLPYIEGLDAVLFNERTGENFGRIYLLGQLREGAGFPGYFFVAFLLKVPLGLQALILLSVVDWWKDMRAGRDIWPRTYLLIPVAVFLVYFNFFFRAQIGLRFMLVAFPCLIVLAAQVVGRGDRAWRARSLVAAGLAVYAAASALSYFPDFIPYFNETVLDRKQSYRFLADSNIIWGQSDAFLQEELAAHPEYIFEPEEPSSGLIVVGVNRLTGVLGDPEEYQWLRDHFTPIGHIRYTHLIFEVSRQELEAAVSAEREGRTP